MELREITLNTRARRGVPPFARHEIFPNSGAWASSARARLGLDVKSFRDSDGFTRAVAMGRSDVRAEDAAEVIDLVHLPPGTRPTPFASLEFDEVNRCRVLDCGTYDACLSFAARLQWPSFHCRQCPKYALGCGTREAYELNTARRSAASGPGAAVIKLR